MVRPSRSDVDRDLMEVGWSMVPERRERGMAKKQRKQGEASGQARTTTQVGPRA